MKTMKVVVLADGVDVVRRFHPILCRLQGTELHYLITYNGQSGLGKKARFWLSCLFHSLRSPRRIGLPVLRGLLGHRMHLTSKKLHDPATLEMLASISAHVGLHATGVIYRRPLLNSFSMGVLNAHIGLLPRYRGRCVMEWSVLEAQPTGITVFFMDEGIDTGARIVVRQPVVVTHRDIASCKSALFALDAQMYARALERLRDEAPDPPPQTPDEGARYYVMSELFLGVVEHILHEPTLYEPTLD